jgi:hypothetical protein
MSRYPYLDRSEAFICELVANDLASRSVGFEIGRSAKTITSALGTIEIDGAVHHLALKWGYSSLSAMYSRLVHESAQICVIAEKAPEVEPKLPYFVAGLTAGDDCFVGIITEDATQGGVLPIRDMKLTESTRQVLTTGFGGTEFFDTWEMDYTVAFDVGGEERLLDFTPPMIDLGYPDVCEARDRVIELTEQDRLQLNVPLDSALIASLGDEVYFSAR